jgi:hypothetical protein
MQVNKIDKYRIIEQDIEYIIIYLLTNFALLAVNLLTQLFIEQSYCSLNNLQFRVISYFHELLWIIFP